MNTRIHPHDLTFDLLSRSVCAVQVAAVIYDVNGIFAWGWNSAGPSGYGQCAEMHAIGRANRGRMRYARLAVVGQRVSSGSFVNARPCMKCQKVIAKMRIPVVEYYDRSFWNYSMMVK